MKDYLRQAIDAAEAACSEILNVYQHGDFHIEAKADNSPLTVADKRAHDAIVRHLNPTGFPILSEEGKSIPYEERENWKLFWMVDPLDGTKEFIKRNGEFTVNIALIESGKPVLGVVAVPVTGEVYYASRNEGAWKKEGERISRLQPRKATDLSTPSLRVVASRSHLNEQTEIFINQLINPSLVSAGSSLKFMLLATGQADVYPRFAPTMEWDTAAAHAIVIETGLQILQEGSGLPLQYNKPNLLNPGFVCK
jgi:3'(2'), 5'-bisphosphate nucleotidase